jgi:hypothetical protein
VKHYKQFLKRDSYQLVEHARYVGDLNKNTIAMALFKLHFSESLQHDLNILEKVDICISVHEIFAKTGYYSGLSLEIRKHLQFSNVHHYSLKLQRIDEKRYPGWFNVISSNLCK